MATTLQVSFLHFLGWSVPTDHLKLPIILPPFTAGAIPDSLGNLLDLTALNLSYNKLTGVLFLIFKDGQCRMNVCNFSVLFVRRLLFTGTMPEAFGNLHNLRGLSLQSNHLTG